MAEESEEPQDEAEQLPFDFAPAWPEDIQNSIHTLYGFDLDDVRGRNRLGDISFEEAPRTVDSIRAIVADLAQEPWDQLPDSLTSGQLVGQLNGLNTVLQQMLGLSSSQEGASVTKADLDRQLAETYEWIKREARPHALTAPINRRVAEIIAERDGVEGDPFERMPDVSELEERVQRLLRELGSKEDVVSGLREASGESAGADLGADFAARAGALDKTIQTWFRALIGAGIGALIGATVTFVALRPDEGAKDASDFAALGLGVFILGLLVFGVRVCAQNYRVNRHLQVVAKSKAAALSTFRRLISSIEDEEIRSATALAVAQAVFATEDTGLVDSTGDHVTLVERVLSPRIGGTPPTS